MNGKWHIDALDARGGIAFASRRRPDLHSDDANLDLPAVLVAPPFFLPETVSSRATGLAATRGTFQLGLFAAGQEIAFPTLVSLVEFVRRAYLAGGGGDGGNGVGPAPPPVPPDTPSGDPPEKPPDAPDDGAEPATGRYGRGRVLKGMERVAGKATGTVTELGLGETSRQVDFRSDLDEVGPDSGDGDGLADAAASLMAELLRRSPRSPDAGWLDAAVRLGPALDRLALWDPVFKRHGRRLLAAAGNAAKGLGDEMQYIWERDSYTHPHFETLSILFGGRWAYWRRYSREGQTDPMDDLASWPLPSRLGLPSQPDSLRDLVSLATASPQLIASPEVAALLVFAAVHLTAGGSTVAVGPGGAFRRDRAVTGALRWLGDQLPNHLYRPELERMIEDSALLRSAPSAASIERGLP